MSGRVDDRSRSERSANGVVLSEAGSGEALLIDVIDPDLLAIEKAEGAKGCIVGLQHIKYFNHQYPPCARLGQGADPSAKKRAEQEAREPVPAK